MRTSLCILSSLLLLCVCAGADTLVLPGTGFDSGGNPLTNGGIDAWWTLNLNPVDQTHNAYAITSSGQNWWFNYVDNTNMPGFNGSGWITTNATSGYNGPAPYTFSMSFDLSHWELNTVSIKGLWSVADGGTLDINGHLVATLDVNNWTAMHPYTINNSADFVQGTNTISITVTQSDLYYEGARFEGALTGREIPEPSSLALLGSGIVAVFSAVRRKMSC